MEKFLKEGSGYEYYQRFGEVDKDKFTFDTRK